MPDSKPKNAIPLWQRAQPNSPPSETPVYARADVNEKGESRESAETVTTNTNPETLPENDEPESVPSSDTSPTTAPRSEAVAGGQQYVFLADDFDAFKQQQSQRSAPPPQPQQSAPAAPPIITYPEFLVEAHKPPPLITPGLVLNTVYAAGSVAALLYGASKWIINPMVETLSDSRHDFLSHSQSKIDEMNERLSSLVSKMPDSKPLHPDAEAEDDGSDISDPTELYHRDMGTQTDTPSTPSTIAPEEKKDHVQWATTGLEIMKSHIEEMTEGLERGEEPHKDRLEAVNKLRHYLDSLIYGSPSMSSWQIGEDSTAMRTGGADKPVEDAIEDLKKEIRGVKGVLLSAKRFPTATRPVSGAA